MARKSPRPAGLRRSEEVPAGQLVNSLRNLSQVPESVVCGAAWHLTCCTWGSLAKEILAMEWDATLSSCPFNSPSSTSTMPEDEDAGPAVSAACLGWRLTEGPRTRPPGKRPCPNVPGAWLFTVPKPGAPFGPCPLRTCVLSTDKGNLVGVGLEADKATLSVQGLVCVGMEGVEPAAGECTQRLLHKSTCPPRGPPPRGVPPRSSYSSDTRLPAPC